MVRTILLEDNASEALLFEAALQEIKYKGTFNQVKSAKAFSQVLIHQKTISKKEDVILIFLDIVMPKESGLEVLKGLKSSSLPENTLIFCFSGLAYDRIINLAYQLGTNAYLFKPTDFDELVIMLGKLYHYAKQHFMKTNSCDMRNKKNINRDIQKLFISKF